METLIAPFVNLLILITVLAVYLKAPLKAFIVQRAANVGDELKKVRESLREAQIQNTEFSAKLQSVEVEITALKEQAKQEAQAAKLRILSDAQKACGGVVADARSSADGLYTELKNRLFSEVGAQVLNRAEAIVMSRLTSADRARIRHDFSTQVEASK